ncbi:kinetochore protein spc25-like isoform X1 [Hibiscus syriacus]|uniref:Kinetochore protein spc25-like isoform X1 n=1 Tax=Hibiscus syriacus TaxID=106335 RepID=A0A6A3B5Q7_HIBSY|nr:kinetochore protein spc25-like isoform X1 [Hibiscus syriacus]
MDLGSNRLTGFIPEEISGCRNLTFGTLPVRLSKLVSLQFVDFSDNVIQGTLSSSLGSLSSLTKLILGKNRFSASIPTQLGSCLNLQLLDLSSNQLTGNTPASLGKITTLEIALNLSWNQLTGDIPENFTALMKLGILEISHNQLVGDLQYLAGLQNLVVLNVSHNNFTGRVPDTPFFLKLPLSVLSGNHSLCFSGNQCFAVEHDGKCGGYWSKSKAANVAMVVLLCMACALLLAALYIIISSKKRCRGPYHDCENANGDADLEMDPPWELTLYQKLDLSIADVVKPLTAGNIIGRCRTGVVYKVTVPSGVTIAVKRFRRAANSKTKMLFYDYMANDILGALLHDGGGRERLDWDMRFKITLGLAEWLAYLRHDCVPVILHGDMKSHNILLGDCYEPRLADFGLARLVDDENGGWFSANPEVAGSYGYMSPGDYLSFTCDISEKVYDRIVSFRFECWVSTALFVYFCFTALFLCVLHNLWSRIVGDTNGGKPVGPSSPEGQQHVTQWVKDQLKKKEPVQILDSKLQGHPDAQVQEMLQALGISLVCTSNRPQDRPTMKDVAALLKEIRQEEPHKPTCNSISSKQTQTTPSYYSSSSSSVLLLQGSSQS